MVQLVEQDPLLGLGLFALADIHQQIDRPDYLASAVAKRCRIWNERNPGPVGTLRHDFGVADGTTLIERHRHGGLVMLERPAVRMVKLPRDAPFVAPLLRAVAPWKHEIPSVIPTQLAGCPTSVFCAVSRLNPGKLFRQPLNPPAF